MSDRKQAYGSNASVTITLASLATSSTLVAGQESTAIDNTTALALDYLIEGKITVGTGPTANTFIEVWAIPIKADGSTWPDVFDGTDSAETVTTRQILLNVGKLVARMGVDTNTSDRAYHFSESARDVFRGPIPKKFSLFVTHSTGVNLNSTGGNHSLNVLPMTETLT